MLLSTSALAQSPRPESKRISIDVVRADIHDVLRMLAEVGRLNVVVADEVQGKVTLRLRDVPWRQVLDTVLASNELGQELHGNVLRVAPLKQLTEEAEAHVRLKKAREEAAPLHTYFIPVNYARAAELLPQVQAQLSPRGKVSLDARTNTLIVTDVAPVTVP
jgi:type IV pilus assembly protein PilQ